VVQKVVRLSGGGSDVKDIELWERECETLATLDHPAIPAYLDHYTQQLPDGDQEFVLIQSFVEGDNLAQVIAAGRRWTEAEWLHLARQLLHILGYLHELNPPVIHRDVKPSNIILQADNRLALVDFGGVQSVMQEPMGGSTVVGTHGYMPPEQLIGRASPSSDLYGMAATLVHLASGIAPSTLPMDRMQLRFRDVVHLSPRLEDWLGRLLAPMVEDRPSTARQALAELESALKPPPVAVGPVAVPKTLQKVRLAPNTVRFINYALVALFFGAVIYFFSAGGPSNKAEAEVETEGAARVTRTSARSGGKVPIKLNGSAGLKMRVGHSHTISRGLEKAYYMFNSNITWTGSASFALTEAQVVLFDDSGQEVDRFDASSTLHGAPLQPGDSFTLGVSLAPTVLGAAVRAELVVKGRQTAVHSGDSHVVGAVRWPSGTQWQGTAQTAFETIVRDTQFVIRGRSSAGTSRPYDSWVDVAVVRGGQGPALDWLEFSVRAVAPDKSTRCRGQRGYPVNIGKASFQPQQTRVTRQSCRGLEPDDRIEIDVVGLKFGD
jgi:hypothetical protein